MTITPGEQAAKLAANHAYGACRCCGMFPMTPPLQICSACRDATERFLKQRRKNVTGKAPLADRLLP